VLEYRVFPSRLHSITPFCSLNSATVQTTDFPDFPDGESLSVPSVQSVVKVHNSQLAQPGRVKPSQSQSNRFPTLTRMTSARNDEIS